MTMWMFPSSRPCWTSTSKWDKVWVILAAVGVDMVNKCNLSKMMSLLICGWCYFDKNDFEMCHLYDSNINHVSKSTMSLIHVLIRWHTYFFFVKVISGYYCHIMNTSNAEHHLQQTSAQANQFDVPAGFTVFQGPDSQNYLVQDYMVPSIKQALMVQANHKKLWANSAAMGVSSWPLSLIHSTSDINWNPKRLVTNLLSW